MALTFNLSRCDKSACFDAAGKLTPTAEVMIFATLFVGMPEINEKTLAEFMWRMEFDRRMDGRWYRREDQSKPITVDFVRPFFGLSTNATKLTRAKFVKNALAHFNIEIARSVREQTLPNI